MGLCLSILKKNEEEADAAAQAAALFEATMEIEAAKEAKRQRIIERGSDIPAAIEAVNDVMEHSEATLNRVRAARKIVASKKAGRKGKATPSSVDFSINDMMYIERALKAFTSRLKYSMSAIRTCEEFLEAELDYKAYYAATEPLGLTELADLLKVIQSRKDYLNVPAVTRFNTEKM